LRQTVISRLLESMALYDDFIAAVPETALGEKLGALRSNTIGEQLWCVVGARESYAASMSEGAWAGFRCSLGSDRAREMGPVAAAIEQSSRLCKGVLETPLDWNDVREALLIDLLEHEAQHQGQLIRYLYGLGITVPTSWKNRYNMN
jgi:hypothetical protein